MFYDIGQYEVCGLEFKNWSYIMNILILFKFYSLYNFII